MVHDSAGTTITRYINTNIGLYFLPSFLLCRYYYHAADSIASTMTGQQDKLKKRRQDAEDKANGKGDGKDEL